ncbi:MAG: hypothetical protein PWQ97_461 [Tepidanaerobacteraceae bacterium]|nr:hypothetical protein [Tepidanaerobacteraceae bacterium]
MEVVHGYLVDLLIALLGLACSYAIYYIRRASEKLAAEAEKIRDEKQAELVKNAVARAKDLATTMVEKTEQTMASEMRQAVKDGKIDRVELQNLGIKVYEEVYSNLSDDVKQAIESEINDVYAYIQGLVESAVLRLKNGGS